MREPSIDKKQQVLKEFLYHIRKDKRVDVEENKLFKLSFKYMGLTKEQVLSCDSEVKENIGDTCDEGTFEAFRFFENLKEYHLSLVKDHLSWFSGFAELLEATEDFNAIFEVKQSIIPNRKSAEYLVSDREAIVSAPSAEKIQEYIGTPVKDTEQIEQQTPNETIEENEEVQRPIVSNSGEAYQEGLVKLKENDISSAIDFFQIGVDAGDVASVIQMAKLHEDCSTSIYSPTKAFTIYEKLSSEGVGEATRTLAIMTSEGRGVGINSPKAVSIFEKAIQQGDVESKEMLEDLLMTLTPEELERSKLF
ncbi:MAG: sel1 repeat family protein [Candidatus Cloacimonetes bacterium]|nr:sel1 repeat family protein [Candidatus Cloacimonadota bacterium]